MEDTLSYYKEAVNRKREIPVSSCPTQFEHRLYSGQHLKNTQAEKILFDELLNQLDEKGPQTGKNDRPKKSRHTDHETRFRRVERIRERHPDSTFTFCCVNTDNEFSFEGRRYQIDASIREYQPIETAHGSLYDADQIVVVHSKDGLTHFYSQQLTAIEPDKVMAI